MRILIVDDDYNSRFILARTLQHSGYEVVAAPDGEEAWKRYNTKPFQFVVADFRMPELNGPGLCRRIRAAKNSDYTYIILLQTEKNPVETVEGLDAGADVVMMKPVNREELEARLRAGMRVLQMEQSLREKTEQNKEVSKRMRWFVQREQLLNQVLKHFNESLELSEILRSAMSPLQEMLQTSRAFVTLYDESTQMQQVAGEHCASDIKPLGDFKTRVDFSEISAAYVSNSVRMVSDLVTEKGQIPEEMASRLANEFNVRAMMAAPIVHQGKWLGTVGLHQCDDVRLWKEEEVSLLSEIAQTMAIAVTNAQLYHQIQQQAIRDGLTGLFNRRYFDQTLAIEMERAKRYGHYLSLILLDLDHLKKINDQLGHQAGDKAIREIGQVLNKLHRRTDSAARYGGEEFAVIISHVPPRGAMIAAETWRGAINEIFIEENWRLSASLGVATWPVHADNAADLIRAADTALYKAKNGGRNRVCMAEEIHQQESEEPAAASA
jgi:diguanylate cyclase (GGDEF)-like protein